MTKKQENLLRARKIERHLRPPTLPVGIKFWKKGEQIPPEAGDAPEHNHSWCQFISLARFNAETRAVTLVRQENILCPIAPGILGMERWPDIYLEGAALGNIHFANAELAASAARTIPRITTEDTAAITVGPLENLGLEPDIIVLAVTPGRCNKVFDGALWYKGGRFIMGFSNGCGICADATAGPYINPDPVAHLSFPCHGARRWGGWRDDELACSVRIDKLDTWIEGMENTFLSGHSYPVAHQLTSELRDTHHDKFETPYDEFYPYGIRP